MNNSDFNNLARQAEHWRTVANFVKENDTRRGSGESLLADDDIVDIVIRVLRDRVKEVERVNKERAAWFAARANND